MRLPPPHTTRFTDLSARAIEVPSSKSNYKRDTAQDPAYFLTYLNEFGIGLYVVSTWGE
jgi:hypothetical protein